MVRTGVALLALLAVSSGVVACGSEPDTLASGSSTVPAPTEVAMVPWCSDLRSVPAPDGPLSSDPEVAKQQQVRATLGLRSDEAWTRSVMAGTADDPIPPGSPSAVPPMSNLSGADITPHESMTIMLSGDPVASSVLTEYGQRFPDSFGGVWLDNTTHSMTIGFTSDIEQHRAEIGSLTATPANLPGGIDPSRTPTTSIADLPFPVHVVQVDHTAADLTALSARLVTIMEGAGGTTPAPVPDINGVGTATDLNAIEVDVTEVTDAKRAWLAERFGSSGLCVSQQSRAVAL